METREAGKRLITKPPEGSFVGINYQSVRYGFRIPVYPLLSQILNYYGLVPDQLVPNSYRLVVSFLTFLYYLEKEVSLLFFHQLFRLLAVSSIAPRYVQIRAWDGRCFLDKLESSHKG